MFKAKMALTPVSFSNIFSLFCNRIFLYESSEAMLAKNMGVHGCYAFISPSHSVANLFEIPFMA